MGKLIDLVALDRFLEKVKQLIAGKASKDLSDVEASAFAGKSLDAQAELIYTASSDDGVAYTATVPGITELYAGLKITFKFSRSSASTTPTLNVNGLGAKGIRQPLSVNNVATAPGALPTWVSSACPMVLTYTGSQWKTDVVRPSSGYLYGSVPVTNGGTGANTAEAARTNLGAASQTDLEALMARVEALENQ